MSGTVLVGGISHIRPTLIYVFLSLVFSLFSFFLLSILCVFKFVYLSVCYGRVCRKEEQRSKQIFFLSFLIKNFKHQTLASIRAELCGTSKLMCNV